MFVGGLPAAFKLLLFGRWRLRDSSGVYGEKTMIEVLRIVRGFWRRLSLYFSVPCISRQLVLFLLW
jgi:hypothetical protein